MRNRLLANPVCRFSILDQFAEAKRREALPLAKQDADRMAADFSHPGHATSTCP
jgi:hypothetical protein